MIRKKILTYIVIGILSVVMTVPVGAFAQPASSAEGGAAQKGFSQAQIDQMLAPVALYPDSLLAQILLASTYPSQIVQAQRWVKAHRGWSKARINAALDKMNWDLSVKALVPFPKVLAMMDKHLNWTTNLGEAFLGQQSQVMAQVQVLRQKAYAQGNLKTTAQQKVVVASNDIEIEPANPEVIYVPYYNPWDIYGPWWWPAYPPFAFFPYGGPYLASFGLFGFAAAVGVGPYWNWGDRNMYVNVNRTANINGFHPGFNRNTFRTANFHSIARHQVAGLGRVNGALRPGAHPGTFARSPASSVQKGLARPGVGAVHGFAAKRGTAVPHGPTAVGGNNHGFAGKNNFRGRTFSGSNFGHTAPGFAGNRGAGTFRAPVGAAPHFNAAPGFGGVRPGFGGGAPRFGGGAPHFGGGAYFGGFGGGRR
ncbi:MAG: DUF3300 domain-containing protein [Syntrophobacteraceae bacterium]